MADIKSIRRIRAQHTTMTGGALNGLHYAVLEVEVAEGVDGAFVWRPIKEQEQRDFESGGWGFYPMCDENCDHPR